MLTLTLPERLQDLAACGYDVAITPPLCVRIWEHAQAAGIGLGEL